MPAAARVGDPTSHQGRVGPPGVPTVLVAGLPAAVANTPHAGPACPSKDRDWPCEREFLPTSAVPTVLIGGAPALVLGSTVTAPCSATVTAGAPTVHIGG